MKNLIIGILLGMMVIIGCGDDDSEPKAGICEMCNQDSDCEADLECEGLYDLDTGQPVGEYCIDGPTRVCKIGEGLAGLDTKPIATASADLTTGVAPLTVKFTGSVSEGDAPFSYEWNFGDGESSTEQNPTHIYDTVGTFTAAFTVTDADGDNDSNSVVIKVVQLTIELTATPTTINIDDSNAGTTITITAKVTAESSAQAGKEVNFEVFAKPAGSLASVDPAADVTDANGEATTELSAGIVVGEIVVKGTVGNVSDEVTVTVTTGAAAGVIKGPIEVIICPTIGFTFTAQLADAFGNDVEQAGVSVTFSTDNGTLTTSTVTTDDSGQATAELSSLGASTAVVTATYINTVTFDPVTGGDPLLMPPTAAEIESEGPPSFRTNTLIIDPDTTNNKFGLIGFLVNEDLDAAMKDGTVNLIYAARDLTKVTGTNPFMFVGVTGLCGAPEGDVVDCTGVETEYYIDPDSLDDCDYPLIFTKGTVTDGALSVTLGELELSFPVEDEIIPLKLCDVEVAGTVTTGPWAIKGNKIDGSIANTCQAGCASLSGFITVDELCILVDVALGPGMCELAKGLLGDPDGDCSGEDAYSMRLLFKANEVSLYEAP